MAEPYLPQDFNKVTTRSPIEPMFQLNPPIPIETPRGSSLAIGWIDYGPEHSLIWITFDDKTGQCWSWPNEKIRAAKNITMGRISPEKPDLDQ